MILDEWNLEFESESPNFCFMCSDDVWWFTFTVKDAFCERFAKVEGESDLHWHLRAVNYEPP